MDLRYLESPMDPHPLAQHPRLAAADCRSARQATRCLTRVAARAGDVTRVRVGVGVSLFGIGLPKWWRSGWFFFNTTQKKIKKMTRKPFTTFMLLQNGTLDLRFFFFFFFFFFFGLLICLSHWKKGRAPCSKTCFLLATKKGWGVGPYSPTHHTKKFPDVAND